MVLNCYEWCKSIGINWRDPELSNKINKRYNQYIDCHFTEAELASVRQEFDKGLSDMPRCSGMPVFSNVFNPDGVYADSDTQAMWEGYLYAELSGRERKEKLSGDGNENQVSPFHAVQASLDNYITKLQGELVSVFGEKEITAHIDFNPVLVFPEDNEIILREDKRKPDFRLIGCEFVSDDDVLELAVIVGRYNNFDNIHEPEVICVELAELLVKRITGLVAKKIIINTLR